MLLVKPLFFATQQKFRAWLEKNHDKETELLVGFYKKESGRPSMTWPESVDQALCFGWIDGVRKRIDEESYTIRFSRRRPTSIWSRINIGKVKALIAAGLMKPAGMRAFELRDPKKSEIYAFENRPRELAPELEKRLRANRKAWTFFETQPPGYKKLMSFWIMSAKRDETRESRLTKLIDASENEKRL